MQVEMPHRCRQDGHWRAPSLGPQHRARAHGCRRDAFEACGGDAVHVHSGRRNRTPLRVPVTACECDQLLHANPQLWGQRQIEEAEMAFHEQLNSAASRVKAEDARRTRVVQETKAAMQVELKAVGAFVATHELNAALVSRLEASNVREECGAEELRQSEAQLAEMARMHEKQRWQVRRAHAHAKLNQEMANATMQTQGEVEELRAERDALVEQCTPAERGGRAPCRHALITATH